MVEKAAGSFEKGAFLGGLVSAKERPALEESAKIIRKDVLLFGKESDTEKKRRSESGRRLLEEIVSGATNYENAKNIMGMLKDNGEDVTDMEEGLKILTVELTYSMIYSGNTDMDDAVRSGISSKVKEFLPESLDGLEDNIVEGVVTNEAVRGVLREVDSKYSGIKLLPKNDRNAEMVKVFSEARMGLVEMASDDGLIPEGHEDREELEITVAYLSTMIEDREEKQPKNERKEKKKKKNDTEIPRTKEGQLALCRGLLNSIESSERHTGDYQTGQLAFQLERLLPGLESSVATEVRSRLKLIDCYIYMKKANGYVAQPRTGGDPEAPTIGMAANRAAGNNHALDREAINFFLKSNANGIPVAKAWDMLEYASFYYRSLLDKMTREGFAQVGLEDGEGVPIDDDPTLGRTKTNYYSDGDFDRRRTVREYMVEQLGGSTNARKAVDLAHRLSLAVAETSVFNAACSGNDELAEDIHLKLYRQARIRPGRNRGPNIHVDKIEGIGTSWLRFVSKVKNVNKPMYARDVKADLIPEGSYTYFFPVWASGKIHLLRGLLMERAPDPKEINNLKFLLTAVYYFNKAEGENGSKNLRYWWAAGVLDMAVTQVELGWTVEDFSRFLTLIGKEKLSEEAGTFLKKDKLKKMLTDYRFPERMMKFQRKQRKVQFLTSFVDGFFGGASKRR